MFSPSGRAVCSTRGITTETGKEVGGRKALVVAYVNAGSARERRDFEYHCKKWGAVYNVLQTWEDSSSFDGKHDGEFVIAVELIGTPEGMEAILCRDCVRDWHDAIAPVDKKSMRNRERRREYLAKSK